MNLFELFVKIGVDDQASGKLGELSGKLGNGLKTAAKIGTAAVGAAAAGITALTTAAVNNYAEYEQLVGGVETLFKDSADKVQEYAANAYKTAGMSANEYMSTVTSFSASLLQSLGGDTEAAAEYANQALTDMSDNANKMGTSMEMIQNAYQGFAKQNYTMLDNLKLGYGGTKEEMARLIKDAAKLDKSIDANDMSFANIVKSINAVQTEMGITGTTALEAGRTISGSVGAMKSAWTNLVTGFADGNADIEGLINDLATTIVGDGTENNLGVIGNVLPAIETALDGIAKLIEGAAPKIIEILPGLVERIAPSVVSAATGMVNSVIAVLPDLLNTVVDALIQNAPVLITAAIGLMQSLIQGIQDNYQILVDGAIQIVTQLSTGILNMLPQIVALGLDLIVSLANGIAESLPELIPTIIDVVLQIVDTLTNPDSVSKLLVAAAKIIGAVAIGLIEAVPGLVIKIPEIISSIVDGFSDAMPDIVEIGKDIVRGLWEGIKSLSGWIGEKVTGFFNGLFDDVKENEEIHSPSKKWAYIGKNMALGLGNGWDKEYNGIKRSIESGLNFGAATVDFSSSGLGVSSAGIINGVANSGSESGREITVNLMLPDGTALARYFLPSFIDVARSDGTPILNPL